MLCTPLRQSEKEECLPDFFLLFVPPFRNLDPSGKFESDSWIEKIVIRGVKHFPRSVHIYLDGKALLLTRGLGVDFIV